MKHGRIGTNAEGRNEGENGNDRVYWKRILIADNFNKGLS